MNKLQRAAFENGFTEPGVIPPAQVRRLADGVAVMLSVNR